MAGTSWRNKLSIALGNSVTLANVNSSALGSGPSAFSGPSPVTGFTVASNPGTGLATVLQAAITTATKARLDVTLPSPTSAISASARIRFTAMPATTWSLWQLNTDTSGTTRAQLSINLQSTGNVQFAVMNSAGTVNYTTYTGGTFRFTTNTWYRINCWGDVDGQKVGLAIYDDAGTQVFTQTWTGVDIGTVGTTKFTTAYTGKADVGNANTTAYLSGIAMQFGSAEDIGGNPSFAVDTPPTISAYVPKQSKDAGQVFTVYARTSPTTSGATEGQLQVVNVSCADLDGVDYPEALSQLVWVAPDAADSQTATAIAKEGKNAAGADLLPMRARQAKAPYLPKTAVYTVRVTGTDSTTLTATVTTTMTVHAHDMWQAGKPARIGA